MCREDRTPWSLYRTYSSKFLRGFRTRGRRSSSSSLEEISTRALKFTCSASARARSTSADGFPSPDSSFRMKLSCTWAFAANSSRVSLEAMRSLAVRRPSRLRNLSSAFDLGLGVRAERWDGLWTAEFSPLLVISWERLASGLPCTFCRLEVLRFSSAIMKLRRQKISTWGSFTVDLNGHI